MASQRRHRSSTAASRGMPPMNNQIAELQEILDSKLLWKMEKATAPPAVQFPEQSTALRRIRQLLIESHETSHTKDAFRHVNGFDEMLELLRNAAAAYASRALTGDARSDFFDVTKSTLDVLSDALHEHSGNKRFFAKRVQGGGWVALEQALASTGIFGAQSDSDVAGQEQLLGCLFAFALGEEDVTRIFRETAKTVGQTRSKDDEPEAGAAHESQPSDVRVGSPAPMDDTDADVDIDAARSKVRSLFSGTEVLQNPDVIPTIVRFWRSLPRDSASSARSRTLSVSVILALLEIASLSSRNKAEMHVTGVLSNILPALLDSDRPSAEARILRDLADSLIEYGVNCLDDAYYLFRKAASSVQAADFLQRAMHSSRGPPFIQFDLSLEGFSAIELPDMGRPFPPVSPGGGYTLACWIRVDKYDDQCHTTIFGAYDDTQTCFLMAYLEKDTRCFILQTYMGHSVGVVPSVRFKKAPRFDEGRWYHVAVVHRRAKAMGLGSHKASLYVNGEFTETMKAHYPSHPPVLEGSHESVMSLNSNGPRQHHILAFLGTPRNLAPRLGQNVLKSKLSVASFHLFSEALSDELIAVYNKLGPRYCGNFQDRLGSFQTYRTSAELHVQNEMLHPGKEERSDIVSAIRLSAGHLMPESKILLSFSPSSVMDDDDRNAIDESQLIRSLSKDSARSLHRYTRMHGTPIIVNAAVPSVNDALSQARGFGRLSGSPIVVVPQALDDAMWRVGGCAAVGLKLVQAAQTLDGVLRAVNILLGAVEGNWRNCEAMEQNNGFAVLAEVLRQKIGNAASGNSSRRHGEINASSDEYEAFLSQLLRTLLHFVGYDETQPAESLIINPLAYRVLLVDFEIWRQAVSLDTQKLYYKQFIDFAKGSKHHHYNAKRFHRIRVVKRLTDALKGETFTPRALPFFLAALKSLLKINFNGENARSLSLFVTYALHDGRASFAKKTLRPKASVLRLRKGSHPNSTPGSTPRSSSPGQMSAVPLGVPLVELGVSILQMLNDLLCDSSDAGEPIRFAKNVTAKWLLYLMAEPDQRVVVLSARILARLLVANGPHYVRKFADKSGGFVVMKNRLRLWWNTPGIWTICFAILFGRDVATIDFERDFDVFNLVEVFVTDAKHGQISIAYPEILPVIVAMLETGLRTIVRDQTRIENEQPSDNNSEETVSRGRRRTMSLNAKQPVVDTRAPPSARLDDYAIVLNSAIQFLSQVHSRSESFRDFAAGSNYVQELLFVLYPVIVTSDSVSAQVELLSRGSALTFEGQDVMIQPLSKANSRQAPVIRTSKGEIVASPSSQRVTPFRRASSFVLVSSDKASHDANSPRLNPMLSTKTSGPIAMKVGSTIIEAMLEVVMGVFQDQLLNRKDFPGLGIFLKTPPGFQEHQAYFESYMLRHTISSITNELQLKQNLLHEPRVLTNLSRFVTHISDAVFEGWFLDGAEPLLEFAGFLLEYLERPDISKMKSVRLCNQAVGMMRGTFARAVLLRLAEPEQAKGGATTLSIVEKMVYWQPIILSAENTDLVFLRLLCYLLYTKLSSSKNFVRMAAANFWRLLLDQKPDDASAILARALTTDKKRLYDGFQRLSEVDNDMFLEWFDENKKDLDAFFYGTEIRAWEQFVHDQNKKTESALEKRVAKRREKLKMWQQDELHHDRTWTQHENSTSHWRTNIHASERIKHQRVLQDFQDNTAFLATVITKLDNQLRGPCALFDESPVPKWRLDETEGRDRKRMRVVLDINANDQEYQPKRSDTDPVGRDKLKVDTAVSNLTNQDAAGVTPVEITSMRPTTSAGLAEEESKQDDSGSENEDDFEMVDAMLEDDDGFEDKLRKVMRSLNRGEQVQQVFNVSRIVGLEAVEGLLIVGQDSLYLLDDFFQRSDGEIVRVWQAPLDERDPFVQILAGQAAKATQNASQRPMKTREAMKTRERNETTRHWKWSEVISISRRRFLHREVAMEVFFDDGRSYLLTAINRSTRNDIHQRLLLRAPHVASPDKLPNPEVAWRLDSLRNVEDTQPQNSFGFSRFASAFTSSSSHPLTRKWMKGELSNFHYLMYINTLSGRSFNDLTQYPVFPWVIADYTSEVLDLNNPRTFRDLTKPIGIQDPRQEEYIREKYNSLIQDGDAMMAPFHYGTHYSSAMTVASYLLRLQPFTASFVLLQSQSSRPARFDETDRMFFSIIEAWKSASGSNSNDNRELTPEFFYLPEFLTNVNGFNFGVRQSGLGIDNVELPPWAHGDPAIFIAKQREALESPHVSRNLHHWIDLIFGYKQNGQAAVDALNTYNSMTYQGGVDMDALKEELLPAAIAEIHGFGQTPSQMFSRPHPSKDENAGKQKKIDTAAESLTRVPGTLLEANDRVSSLAFIEKGSKLLCSAPFRHNIPPTYDRYMEWGFTDGSVRFYDSSSKRLVGLFEHLHSGQLTASLFVDGKTFITAGTDCTVAVWNVIKTERNSIDLQNATMLFGHKAPVITLAASAAFAAFLSASSDGRVFLWDLNRSEFVRELDLGMAQKRNPVPVQAARINNATGHIVLACGPRLIVTTLNGKVLLNENICVGEDEEEGITAIAVYEGGRNEWCERELIFTGHRRGVVKIFQLAPDRNGLWTITILKMLNHTDSNREDGANHGAAVTCILPMPGNVYTGDEEGRVYEWDCVHRQD